MPNIYIILNNPFQGRQDTEVRNNITSRIDIPARVEENGAKDGFDDITEKLRRLKSSQSGPGEDSIIPQSLLNLFPPPT